MAKGRLEYINKKNQAPSYCDRVLYRNNSCLQINEDYYNCLDTVYGSDHRPVALCLTVQDFFKPGNFCEIDRLFDVNNPHLGYGEFDVQMIDLKDLNIATIKAVHKIEFKTNLAPLMLRVSFYDCALDTFSSPIIFSREIKANLTESNESTLNATWPEEFLPCLQTAYNSIRLASQSKLLMLVWACG